MATDRYYLGPGLLGSIRRTIRRVDMLPGGESGPTFDPVNQTLQGPRGRPAASGDGIRICTFAGDWLKNTDKTVTLTIAVGQSAADTLVATNILFDVAQACNGSPKKAIVGRAGTAWYLINTEC